MDDYDEQSKVISFNQDAKTLKIPDNDCINNPITAKDIEVILLIAD